MGAPAESEHRRTAEELVAGYEHLFAPAMAAAQRGCLEYAQVFREDRWPTPLEVLAFAKLYGVSPAALGAFFGLILQKRKGGQQVWIDTYRGPVHPQVNGPLMLSHQQAVAYGWHKAAVEVFAAEAPLN